MQNKSFSFVAVAQTKTYNAGGTEAKPDKNGNLPIQLTVVAGKCPNRAIVMSGSVAIGPGIEAGNTYVLQANYRDTNDYGDNWSHTVLGKLTPVDLAQLPTFIKAYGQPQLIDASVEVKVPEGVINGEEA